MTREAPVWLLVAQPRNPATKALTTVRLAGGGARGFRQLGSNDWKVGLERPPAIAQALGFADGVFGEGAVARAFELVWEGGRKTANELADLVWPDAPFTLYTGTDLTPDAQLTIVCTGRVAEISREGSRLTMAMVDPTLQMQRRILDAQGFLGTGGIEGVAELTGRPKRRAWGKVRNVELWLLDPANNIWVATDPAKPLQAIDQVYDKGNAASSLTLVAWAGSIAATLTALRQAAAPQGGAAVAPSIGCIKWWFSQPGKLTADLKGEIGAAYVDRPADIVASVLAAAGAPPAHAASLATARAAVNYEAGWLVEDGETTALDVVQALLAGHGLWWKLTAAAELAMGRWSWTSSALPAVRAFAIDRVRTHRPIRRIELGWRRNHTVMARGDIAAALLIAEVTAVPPVGRDPGFTWTRAGDSRAFVKAGEQLRIGGVRVRLNGQTLKLPEVWIETRDRAIDIAQATADSAIGRVNVLEEDVDALKDAVLAIDDDDILSVSEKVETLIPAAAAFAEFWSAASGLAVAAGITASAAYTTAAAKRTAWLAYLGGISPAWDNISVSSPIVRGSLDAARNEYDAALKALLRSATEGITAAKQVRQEASISLLIFDADHQGVLVNDRVRDFSVKQFEGDVDVTTSCTKTVTVAGLSGGTVTVNAAGIVTVPMGLTVARAGTITLSYDRAGRTIRSVIAFERRDAAAPPAAGGSGGGTAQSWSSFSSVSGTGWTTVGTVRVVKTGSGGEIDCTASLTTSVGGAGIGDCPVEFRFAIKPTAGGSTVYTTVVETGVDAATIDVGTLEEPIYQHSDGTLAGYAHGRTGLAALTDHDVSVEARRTSAIPAKTVFITGTAEAAGS